MFKSVEARFALRATLFGVAGANASLATALPGLSWSDGVTALILGIGSALGYAGIGAIAPAVEPTIGRKLQS
jgi:hypothetical protein